jgi:hypothetical protein
VERFFRLSREYTQNPYNQFYQMNCTITGQLRANGKKWAFTIDGGGTATWRDWKTTRHWGCSAQACAPLVMLLTDGMKG